MKIVFDRTDVSMDVVTRMVLDYRDLEVVRRQVLSQIVDLSGGELGESDVLSLLEGDAETWEVVSALERGVVTLPVKEQSDERQEG